MSAQDSTPRNHMRKVHTGRVGSSVFVTVRRTCSIGEMSSSSSSPWVCMFISGSTVPIVVGGEDEEEEEDRERF